MNVLTMPLMTSRDHLVEESLPIVAADGVRQTLHVLRPAAPVFAPWLVVGLPAMGRAATCYEPFARALADGMHAVVAFADLRGQGSSSAQAGDGARYGFREILELDLPAILEALRARYPGRRLLIAGHGLGGELGAMFAAQYADKIDGLVLLATGTSHLNAWSGLPRMLYRAVVQVVRSTRSLCRFYPGRNIGFGGQQPHTLMRDWLDVVDYGRYRPRGSAINYESRCRYANVEILEIGIDGDPVAPPAARDELVERFASARVIRTVMPRFPRGASWQGHFAWAREPDAMVAAILRWTRGGLRARLQPTNHEQTLVRRAA